MHIVPSTDGNHLYSIHTVVRRLNDKQGLWLHANRAFLNSVRKQFFV